MLDLMSGRSQNMRQSLESLSHHQPMAAQNTYTAMPTRKPHSGPTQRHSQLFAHLNSRNGIDSSTNRNSVLSNGSVNHANHLSSTEEGIYAMPNSPSEEGHYVSIADDEVNSVNPVVAANVDNAGLLEAPYINTNTDPYAEEEESSPLYLELS